MKEFPTWYLLVEYWCQERKRDGLTIPFILGTIESEDIKALLIEISKFKCSSRIMLNHCSDLQEYVLTFVEEPFSWHYNLKRFDNLLIYDDYGKIEEFNSLDELAEFFDVRYSKCISEKRFSLNKNHEWVDFTEVDNWRLNFNPDSKLFA